MGHTFDRFVRHNALLGRFKCAVLISIIFDVLDAIRIECRRVTALTMSHFSTKTRHAAFRISKYKAAPPTLRVINNASHTCVASWRPVEQNPSHFLSPFLALPPQAITRFYSYGIDVCVRSFLAPMRRLGVSNGDPPYARNAQLYFRV